MAEPSYSLITREEGGMPKIVTVRSDIPPYDGRLTYAVVAHLPYQAKDNGLPINGELDRVCRIEDQIIKQLAPTGVMYLGHITFNGTMKSVFYAPASLPPFVEVKAGLFKRSRLQLDVRQDPAWSWFEAEMAPTPLEKHISQSRHLHAKLKELGDRHELTRNVDFNLYFPTDEARASFLAVVSALGYRANPNSLVKAEGYDLPFGCEIQVETSIEPTTIAMRCVYLSSEAHRVAGDFDGWACPVRSE